MAWGSWPPIAPALTFSPLDLWPLAVLHMHTCSRIRPGMLDWACSPAYMPTPHLLPAFVQTLPTPTPLFIFFFLALLWHMEFLGQGSDLCCSCNPRCSCGNAGFPNPLCQAGGSNLHIVPEMLPILSCHSGNSPQHYLIFPTQNYNFSLLESIYSHHTPASTLYNPLTCYIFLPLQTEGKLHEGSVCGFSLLFDLFQN